MKPVRITYDPEGDILYITFGPPTAATGYQLSDQILLRVDPQTQQAAGLTVFNFSVHAHSWLASGNPLPPGCRKQARHECHPPQSFSPRSCYRAGVYRTRVTIYKRAVVVPGMMVATKCVLRVGCAGKEGGPCDRRLTQPLPTPYSLQSSTLLHCM
jgi:uncharacterized protein YuzE